MSSSSRPVIAVAATVAVATASLLLYYFTNKSHDETPVKSTPVDLQEILKLPLIDLSKYFNRKSDPNSFNEECKLVAEALHKYGVLIVRDPRVKDDENDKFIDMMEKFFETSDGMHELDVILCSIF